VGARDELGSLAAQRTMASWIPRHRLEVLDGVGHLIHYEAPGRTAELVHDFLSSPAPEPVPGPPPGPDGGPPALHTQAPPADAPAPDTAPFTGLQRIVRRGHRARRDQQAGRRR
jgi:hypothetical protein